MCALRFIPREEKFYEYFADQASILKEAASKLQSGLRGGREEMEAAADVISELEHRADGINRDVFDKLRKTFITPLDPEDIHTLTSRLEDAIDSLHAVARRTAVFRPVQIPEALHILAANLVEITIELSAAVEALRTGGELQSHCFRIRELEEESDRRAQDGLLALFSSESNPIEVIKVKDLIDMLEDTIDICDDVGDILANVVVKNS
jgi:predicted phosphate transport protein (TIGR00153 family)